MPKTTYIILTYQKNMKDAEETKRVLKEQNGVNASIVVGYGFGENALDGSQTTKNKVLSMAWKDILLPNIPKGQNIVYFEDDIRMNPSVNLKRLVATQQKDKTDIFWFVYRKGKLTNKAPHNVITGTQGVYFSSKAINEIRDWFNGDGTGKKHMHLNGKISKFIREHTDLKFKQSVYSLGVEKDHVSLISAEANTGKSMQLSQAKKNTKSKKVIRAPHQGKKGVAPDKKPITKVPKRSHRMPDGSIMKDSKMNKIKE